MENQGLFPRGLFFGVSLSVPLWILIFWLAHSFLDLTTLTSFVSQLFMQVANE